MHGFASAFLAFFKFTVILAEVSVAACKSL